MKEFFLIISLLFSFALRAEESLTKTLEDDALKIAQYQERCGVIKNLIVQDSFKLDCFTNYNHYGPTSKSYKASTGNYKIANYNLLHPGTSKALFKDYSLVAKIMNRYDIVSGLELLATVGHDEQNNVSVLSLIRQYPDMVKKLRDQQTKLTDPTKIKEMSIKIDKLTNDTHTAYDLYRAPGYLKVLMELKKLDPSWALILSPRGDSALVGSVEELAGYFYRANTVTPAVNPHCKEFAGTGSGTPVACFITLTKEFMDQDMVQHFARRPFMATFKAGNTTFSLVTSHVVYTYSGEEADEKELMQKTFGVDDYKALGGGINSANFARYAEVKNTLDFMNRFRIRYNDKKIMYLADTNLVSNNTFWPEILKAFPGGELLINQPTTLSPAQFMSTGKETNGVANDYDHFILDKSDFPGCDNGEIYNYYKESILQDIDSRYNIRKEIVGFNNNKNFTTESLIGLKHFDVPVRPVTDESPIVDGDIPPTDDPVTIKLDYAITPAGQSKMDKYVNAFEKQLRSLTTVNKTEVVLDDFQVTERIEGLKRRVFLRQLTKSYYYRHMQELLSDHFPVALNCKF